MSDLDPYLRNLVKSRREAVGLSIRDAARQVGCSPTTWGRYDRGRTRPQGRTLAKIRNFLGITDEQWNGTADLNEAVVVARHPDGTVVRLKLMDDTHDWYLNSVSSQPCDWTIRLHAANVLSGPTSQSLHRLVSTIPTHSAGIAEKVIAALADPNSE